jgi:two-component sensor histidine kinase
MWALASSVFVATAQDYPLRHFTLDDGLPNNTIYNIYRDSKGYLWLSSEKGVARYNGINFEIFTTSNGLADNEVFFFQEDYYGRIWLASYNGRLCYYKDGAFYNDINTPFLKVPFASSFIRTIAVEKDSSVTITFMDKRKFINVYKDSVYVYDIHELDEKQLVTRLVVWEKTGPFSFRVASCLKTLLVNCIPGKQRIEPADHNIPFKDDCNYLARAFSQNQSYIYGKYGLYDNQFNEHRKFKSDFFNNNLLYQVYHNDVGWFYGTSNGLYINDSLVAFHGNKLSCITQDLEGNYWVSDLKKGMYMLPKAFLKTKLYTQAYTGTAQFAQTIRNRVFFASSGKTLKTIKEGKVEVVYDFSGIFRDKDIYSIHAYNIDDNGRFFNGYIYGNMVIDDLFASKLKVRNYKSSIISSGAIKNMVGVGDMLYVNNGNTVKLADYRMVKPGDSLIYNQVSDMNEILTYFKLAKAPDNSIWYCNSEHLAKIEHGVGVIQPAFERSDFKSIWFHGKYMLAYNSQNQLMIFSDYASKPIGDTIPAQDCIWDNFYALDKHHILISTNNRYRLLTINETPGQKKFSVADIENTIAPLQAEAITADSLNCYFFKNGNVTSLPISLLISQPSPPKLLFNKLKANKSTYAITDDLYLSYEESKNLSISFSTIDFSSDKVSYQYAVTKSGTFIWQDLAGEEINIVNSGYGDMQISVRARSLSSNYSEPIVFNLHVLRPFWATWWFIALCVVAVIIIIAILVRFRIIIAMRQREKEHNNEIKFMRSEYKALNALMNPHFIFNTLNNVQGLVNRNDKLAANEYLRVFADLIRQNMHNLSKEVITLQKEMDLVSNYLRLEQLRFKERLNFSIVIDDKVDLTEIQVPPLLVQPLVENSIKHGIYPLDSVVGTVCVNIFEKNNNLYIEVKDNGVGMNKAPKLTPEQGAHESFGLDNIRQRLKQLSMLLNQEIKMEISETRDDNGVLQWTIVTIILANS